MTGKIFSESSNVYEDQAKILFKYYQSAAETIVSEEERIEKEIAALEQEKKHINEQLDSLWKWFLFIILFFVYFIKKKQYLKRLDEIDVKIKEFQKIHSEIFRDYKVSRMGVAYVPVADQIKYADKSFIVDYTGKVPESEVSLQVSKQNDLLIDTIGKLEKLAGEAPIIESSEEAEAVETDNYSTSIQQVQEHDYIGNYERAMRTVSYCMDDLDTTSVSLPLVAENSEYLSFLHEFATKEVPENAPVIPTFNKERYVESINKFQEINRLKDSLSTKTQQLEEVLKSLMKNVASSVQVISAHKIASVDKVVLESNKILYQILKSPYNHYSPSLEFEEIERIRKEKFDYQDDVQSYEPFNLKQSSRVKYNILTGLWTAEDGNTTTMPFGVHQIYEEIVAPVVQNLMAENRVERLKIYNNIKDQKLSYLNKWHQDTDAFYRANRAESADIINIMQESLREYIAAYNTLVSLQKTVDSMKQSGADLDSTVVNSVDNSSDSLAAFELQSQEFQKTQADFEDFIDRLKEDIDYKAEKFGHVEYYDAKLRDGYSNEVAVATSEVADLDNRRKALAAVNPLFAKTSELPPQPNVENLTFEHISLNLPSITKNALESLERESVPVEEDKQEETLAPENVEEETPVEEVAAEDNSSEETVQQDSDTVPVTGDAEEEDEEEFDEEEEEDEDDQDDEDDEDYEDDEDDEDEDYIEATEENLQQFSDEELCSLAENYNIGYNPENLDRDALIQAIIEEVNNE